MQHHIPYRDFDLKVDVNINIAVDDSVKETIDEIGSTVAGVMWNVFFIKVAKKIFL